jgi:hypothetical protein
MKRVPSYRPEWLETCAITHGLGNVIQFAIVQDLAVLLWIVNPGSSIRAFFDCGIQEGWFAGCFRMGRIRRCCRWRYRAPVRSFHCFLPSLFRIVRGWRAAQKLHA